MSRSLLSLIAVMFLLGLGAWYVNATRAPRPMSLAEALSVADDSACAAWGNFPGTGTYNAGTGAWWLDFIPNEDVARPGCNPACVVYASTSVAELNWRCTGAIPPASKSDLIVADAPLPDSIVQSPLSVAGRARGNWYFEASFPVKIYDANGVLLGQAPAQAQGEWMTTGYVPFLATLSFAAPATSSGTLVLEKDNPSGLPENADELRIPIRFGVPGLSSFSKVGNVSLNNPGLPPGIWHFVYDEPGAPAKTVRLVFDRVATPTLPQGTRVHVEGEILGNRLLVASISPMREDSLLPIKLFYYDPSKDQGPGGAQCSKNGLVAVERRIPRTSTPLRDSIAELLRGELSSSERSRGITTEFPLPGVELAGATIENGVATLVFADPLNRTGGGSCRVSVLRAQIEETAKQFPSVQTVRLMPEELFQP